MPVPVPVTGEAMISWEISSLTKVTKFSPGEVQGCRQGSEGANGTAYRGSTVFGAGVWNSRFFQML